MRNTYIIIGLSVLLFAAGCARLRDLPDAAPDRQPAAAQAGDPATQPEVGNAAGTATAGDASATTAAPRYETMTVSCGYEGIAASGQVRMKQDSAIWVSVSYLFELGRVMATPDRVRIDLKVLGKSFNGTYAELARATGVHTSFDELQTMLSHDTAGDELTALARRMGYNVRVKVSNRKRAENLDFPM